MPSRPASAAAPATAASQPGGSSCQGNREICRTKPSRAGRRSCSAAARREPGECAGSIAASSGRVTRSQPSAPSSLATAGTRRSWPSRTAAGTLRSRCALRRRQSAGSVSNSTATAGSPACLAASSWARRRAGSSPRVSTTVFRPRFSRAATIWSSRAKASAEASRSCSPLPTTPRSWSEDTTSCGRYLAAPRPTFPSRTRRRARRARDPAVRWSRLSLHLPPRGRRPGGLLASGGGPRRRGHHNGAWGCVVPEARQPALCGIRPRRLRRGGSAPRGAGLVSGWPAPTSSPRCRSAASTR